MIKANYLDYPGFKKGWDIVGRSAMSSGVVTVTIKSGDYSSKISGISHTIEAAYGFTKVAITTSNGDTILTFTSVGTNGSTLLTTQVLNFGFFISVDTNPTDSSMITHNLDIQV